MQTVGVPASTRARRLTSASAAMPALRVLPKAVSRACLQRSSPRARRKNSMSLGFEPGYPPSMYWMPKPSSRRAILSLSSTERDRPSLWVPSLRVVSNRWICMAAPGGFTGKLRTVTYITA